jgi:hypothetical protein
VTILILCSTLPPNRSDRNLKSQRTWKELGSDKYNANPFSVIKLVISNGFHFMFKPGPQTHPTKTYKIKELGKN